ncbi:MAG: hypothetical protein AAGH65_01260, partial [Pseudomonadota bacterium]
EKKFQKNTQIAGFLKIVISFNQLSSTSAPNGPTSSRHTKGTSHPPIRVNTVIINQAANGKHVPKVIHCI